MAVNRRLIDSTSRRRVVEDCLPLLLQQLRQVQEGSRGRIDGADSPPRHVPQMLNGVKFRRRGRTVHFDHPLLAEKDLDDCYAVAGCVVILEDGALAGRLQGQQHQGSEDGIPVRHAGQTTLCDVQGSSTVRA